MQYHLPKSVVVCFAECPVLSKPVNGYKKGNMNTFGSKVILGCNSGFHIPLHVCVLIGNPITSECRNNGTHAYWTVPSWTCKQGAFFRYSIYLFNLNYFDDKNALSFKSCYSFATCSKRNIYVQNVYSDS